MWSVPSLLCWIYRVYYVEYINITMLNMPSKCTQFTMLNKPSLLSWIYPVYNVKCTQFTMLNVPSLLCWINPVYYVEKAKFTILNIPSLLCWICQVYYLECTQFTMLNIPSLLCWIYTIIMNVYYVLSQICQMVVQPILPKLWGKSSRGEVLVVVKGTDMRYVVKICNSGTWPNYCCRYNFNS